MGRSSLLLFEQAENQARPTTDSMLSAFQAGGGLDGMSLLDSQYMFRHDKGYEALERVAVDPRLDGR